MNTQEWVMANDHIDFLIENPWLKEARRELIALLEDGQASSRLQYNYFSAFGVED